MSFSLTLRQSLLVPGGANLTCDVAQTGNVAPQASAAYPTGTTNALLAFTCDHTTLQLLYIFSDKVITIKTNSSGSPADTFVLDPNVPLIWHKDDPENPNPLSAAVTALYITNASGATARLEIRALHN